MLNQRYDHDDFNRALTTLRSGGVVLLPGVDGWYIGADATSDTGVNKLLTIIQNDFSRLELLLDNSTKLSFYLEEVPEVAYDLIELSDKPLTLILQGARRVAKSLLEKGELGFRIVNDLFTLDLCRRLRYPLLIAPATKTADEKSVSFENICLELIDKVDYVVQYNQNIKQERLSPGIIRLGKSSEIEILKK